MKCALGGQEKVENQIGKGHLYDMISVSFKPFKIIHLIFNDVIPGASLDFGECTN